MSICEMDPKNPPMAMDWGVSVFRVYAGPGGRAEVAAHAKLHRTGGQDL